MNHFERIRDVIEYARAFHRELGEYYGRLRQMDQPERVNMLLNHRQEHEDRLMKTLDDFSDEAKERVVKTWFQYSPEKDIFAPVKAMKPESDLSIDQVMKTAMKLDTALIRFIEELGDQTDSDAVNLLFQNLLEMEKAEDRVLAAQTQGIQDLLKKSDYPIP